MLKSFKYFRNSKPTTAPPLWLASLELGRCATEALSMSVYRSRLLEAVKGDGHPVVVFPGLFASDRSTGPLRRLLNDAGFQSYGWGHGTNLGPSRAEDLDDDITELIKSVYLENGKQPVSLIGWSLGGLYARLAAHLMPEKINQVITLGSPINGSPQLTNAWRLYELVSDMDIDANDNEEKLALIAKALPVPSTSIYSKSDSIVAWQISRAASGPNQQNIHVPASHIGMAFSPLVVQVVLDRLQTPVDAWKAFEPETRFERFVYAV
ncbi:MAG: esterase/lipase family protein [Pseudomonadales bacterium]